MPDLARVRVRREWRVREDRLAAGRTVTIGQGFPRVSLVQRHRGSTMLDVPGTLAKVLGEALAAVEDVLCGLRVPTFSARQR